MDINESILKAADATEAAMNFPIDTLQGDGVALLGLLGVLAVVVVGYQTMADPNGNLRKLVSKAIVLALSVGILAWVVGAGFGTVFVEGIDASLSKAADKLFAGAASKDGMVVAAEAWTQIFNAVADAFGRMYEDAGMLDVLTVTAQNIPAIVGLLFSLILIVLNIMAFFSLQALSIMLVKLALLIAPLFLPWALFSQTSFLAAGWLRFFLQAGLLKVLAAGLLMISMKMVKAIAGMMTPDMDPLQSFFIAVSISGVMLTILIVTAKIPQYAKELVSAGIARSGLH